MVTTEEQIETIGHVMDLCRKAERPKLIRAVQTELDDLREQLEREHTSHSK